MQYKLCNANIKIVDGKVKKSEVEIFIFLLKVTIGYRNISDAEIKEILISKNKLIK